MEVIKAQMAKDQIPDAPPVAPHAPAHGLNQPNVIGAVGNPTVELKTKSARPSSVILRQSGALVAPQPS